MKIALIMMQKNEQKLLPVWIDYHAKIVGYENIFIFDNGSTDLICIEVLFEAQKKGVNVSFDYPKQEDFKNKSKVFKVLFDKLDIAGEHDFYFPLDCDEFLAVEDGESVSISRDLIIRELVSHVGENRVLRIGSALDNLPINPGFFLQNVTQRKCFFYKREFFESDEGFHESKTHAGHEYVKTKISYIHMHYRPYEEYVKFSKQKLFERIRSFEAEDIKSYIENQREGFHVLPSIICGKYGFYTGLLFGYLNRKDSVRKIPEFREYELKINFFNSDSLQFICTDHVTGCVDAINIYPDYIVISGWAFSRQGNAPQSAVLGNGFELVSADLINFVERSDVLRHYDDAPINCGFQATFFVKDFFKNVSESILYISFKKTEIGMPFRLVHQKIQS